MMCRKCNKEGEFYFNKHYGYVLKPCKECIKKRGAKNYHKVRERQIKRIVDKYNSDECYRKSIIERSKKWAQDNPERLNENCKRNQKKYISELKDFYVKHNLRKKYHFEATPELIDLHRVQLMLKREVRNILT